MVLVKCPKCGKIGHYDEYYQLLKLKDGSLKRYGPYKRVGHYIGLAPKRSPEHKDQFRTRKVKWHSIPRKSKHRLKPMSGNLK